MMGEPTTKLSPATLRKAFAQDLAAAWNSFRENHAAETPYAFALYGLEGGLLPQLYSAVMTEESLTRVAQRYLEKGHHDTLEESRRALRYSVADSPRFAQKQETLPTVDALLAPYGEIDETAGYAMLAQAAMAAFGELDAQGFFGTGAARERLLLIIITEDTFKDWSETSAKKLNPPGVFQRFQDETKIEGTYASCGSLAMTTDGASFFACITRKDPKWKPGENEFLHEVSGFNKQELRLTRRWSLPEWGRKIVCTPDGRTVVAIEAQWIDKVSHLRLMQLLSDSGKVLNQVPLSGEAAGLAVANDGSRIAVVTHDGNLRFFDGALQLLRTIKPESKPKGALFLRGGELLVATEKGVVQMDASSGAMKDLIAVKAHQVNVDNAEELLCVSPWFYLTDSYNRDPDPFGIKLFGLRSRELVREFIVKGHQCVHGVISSNGKLLAMEAHQIGTPRKLILVFDVATGREIARRKSPSLYQLSFLPDSRTLAIAFAGHVTGEPIALWTW